MRRDLLPTRAAARRAIKEGRVHLDGVCETRPAVRVPSRATISVDPEATRYLGRGGLKLEAALDAFPIDLFGRRAIDVGASTGGFTDCLLQRGAVSVVALDVGEGQLHPTLLDDERVTNLERTDVREIDLEDVGGPFDVVVVDVSFISLGKLGEALAVLGHAESDWIVLVKPQFEVGPDARDRRGVVVDDVVRRAGVDAATEALVDAGLVVAGRVPSPLPGGAGNREDLLWLRTDLAHVTASDDDVAR